jgi:hypothetical protein
MKQDKAKIKVISFIDKIEDKFIHTLYERELRQLRNKYIFKDISNAELIKDINYLKELNTIK